MDAKLSSLKTLIQKAITTRSYYTARTKKPTLYMKISPLGNQNQSVAPELDDWVAKGNKVSVGELQRIIRDLRKRRRFTHALQVSEWMNEKGVCKFRQSEHAVQLDLIGRVRGFVSAEEYFGNLGNEDRDCKTYGALLNCYVRQRQTEKALAHLRKMQEMGFASAPLDYNAIMCLYTKVDQHEKVPGVMAEMKENNVSPDNFSYRICINSYGVRSDLEGVERVLKEMEGQCHIVMDWNTYAVVADFYMKAGQMEKAIDALKKSEGRLDMENGLALGYNFLISLYSKMGNKDEVLRLWGLQKSACKRCINKDFICMLVSLVRLGEFEEAEKVLMEWEMSGNCYDFGVPQTVVVGYAAKGLYERAEALLEDLMEKGKATTLKSWETVAAGYVAKGEMERAFKCMKVALEVWTEEARKPNDSLITTFLSWLGDECSVEDVEAFVGSLRKVIPVNKQMYHALLKAYTRGGEEVNSIVDRMKADKIDHDEETAKILEMKTT